MGFNKRRMEQERAAAQRAEDDPQVAIVVTTMNTEPSRMLPT